ncbi:hypothetical protein NMG60_11026627 [Bertholletia excelsa]
MNRINLFVPILDIYDLQSHIDGSIIPSPLTIGNFEQNKLLNPVLIVWHHIDQLLLTWVNATMDHSLLPVLYNAESAAHARLSLSLILWVSLWLVNFIASMRSKLSKMVNYSLICIRQRFKRFLTTYWPLIT